MGNIGRHTVAKLVKNNIEYRNYDLPEVFPILVLQGKKRVISEIPAFNRHFKKIIGSKPMQWRKEREIVKSTQILKYNGWILPPEQMETEERSEGIV